MSVDWKLLVEVRERQKTVATSEVARERHAADESQALLRQAQSQVQQEQRSKDGHWQGTRQALAGGHCRVAELVQAGAWSKVLDAQIAKASQAAAEAGQAHALREQALEESRRRLRAASGEVEKARQMQQRARADELRLAEVRHEESAEEASARTWALRRPA
jgi:hypothetical protein